jgi:multidrug efflux pump subunit AcrA (membrane-fusion protein)
MTTTEIRPQVEPNYVEYMPEREPERKSRLFLFLMLGVLALLIVGAFTLLQRRTQYRALANETEKMAVPTVSVVHPTPEPGQEDLILPSTTQAYTESPIYARTNGYLKKWYHDIGSRVQKGELLADIDTPEVDQQLSQARADLGTSKANEDLSKITATRYQELIKTDGVSKQEVDKGHYRLVRGQCPASRRTRVIQAYLRSIQRSHHAAQH